MSQKSIWAFEMKLYIKTPYGLEETIGFESQKVKVHTLQIKFY